MLNDLDQVTASIGRLTERQHARDAWFGLAGCECSLDDGPDPALGFRKHVGVHTEREPRVLATQVVHQRSDRHVTI